jgi:hypothetical protein
LRCQFLPIDFTKPAYPILATNGYEIQSCLRIIISFQADAAAVVFGGIVGHGLQITKFLLNKELLHFLQEFPNNEGSHYPRGTKKPKRYGVHPDLT